MTSLLIYDISGNHPQDLTDLDSENNIKMKKSYHYGMEQNKIMLDYTYIMLDYVDYVLTI